MAFAAMPQQSASPMDVRDARIDVRIDSLTRDRSAAASRVSSLDPDGPTFYLETYGCQMNVHDSEKVAGVLLERGYRQVESPDSAALVLLNTCSIREKAAHKVFSRLGVFKGEENGRRFAVLGCVAQQEGEVIFDRAPHVSLVCGSASYRRLPELLDRVEAGEQRVTGLDNDTAETFETEVTRRDHPFRAYITIIEGCDKACTYCVVPFTRGPERSRESAGILEEARRLAESGYTEIQLLGQTVNSYCDPSARKLSFSDLLLAIADTPGIRRVRFTTSHPSDFGVDIVRAIDSHPGICDHVHLPVQSGSTRILRTMRRTYTRDEYLEKVAMIRAARRSISITSDIIVGFPGETDEDFQDTLTILDAAQYDGVFAFKYSPRPNTAAQLMTGSIPEDEQGRRLTVLQERQRQIQTVRNEALVGQSFEVLVDGAARSEGHWLGRTSSNRIINFTSHRTGLLGQYLQVHVTGAGPNTLAGEHAFVVR
jgi:tRNA-2-methylthio-N6-dimethylallyladenosine synthase